jgi:hypothetical protein
VIKILGSWSRPQGTKLINGPKNYNVQLPKALRCELLEDDGLGYLGTPTLEELMGDIPTKLYKMLSKETTPSSPQGTSKF